MLVKMVQAEKYSTQTYIFTKQKQPVHMILTRDSTCTTVKMYNGLTIGEWSHQIYRYMALWVAGAPTNKQPSAVITLYNITSDCIQNCSIRYRTRVRLWSGTTLYYQTHGLNIPLSSTRKACQMHAPYKCQNPWKYNYIAACFLKAIQYVLGL